MRTDATGAKRLSAFNKPPKSIWKHYWKLSVPFRLSQRPEPRLEDLGITRDEFYFGKS